MKMEAVAKAYVRRILRGEITIDDVPKSIVTQVQELLEKEEG